MRGEDWRRIQLIPLKSSNPKNQYNVTQETLLSLETGVQMHKPQVTYVRLAHITSCICNALTGTCTVRLDHPLVLHDSELDWIPVDIQTEQHVSGSCQDCRPVMEHGTPPQIIQSPINTYDTSRNSSGKLPRLFTTKNKTALPKTNSALNKNCPKKLPYRAVSSTESCLK